MIRASQIMAIIALLLVAGTAGGCKRDDMADQDKVRPMRQTQFFAESSSESGHSLEHLFANSQVWKITLLKVQSPAERKDF